MKRIFLSFVFLSFYFVNAHIPEQLNQAIKASDLKLTQELLQKVFLSSDELIVLKDFSQQIVDCRKKDAEFDNPKRTPYQTLILILGVGCCASALINTLKFGFEMAQEDCKYLPISCFWAVSHGLGVVFASDLYIRSRNEMFFMLREKLNNALAIRQLLSQKIPA